MSLWTDLAEWRGPTANHGGPMLEQRGLVIHIAEGGYEGTIAWQKNPAAQVSSHFVTDLSGKIGQIVDTDVTAWTQQAGNGHWLSVENAGFTPGALTGAQCEAIAQLFARGHRQYGWPLQLAAGSSGRGLGHHSMGGTAWGHLDCPGPNVIAQKPAILARAIQIVNGTTEDGMTPQQALDFEALIYRVEAIINNRPAVIGGPTTGEKNLLHDAIAAIGTASGMTPEQVLALTGVVSAAAEAGAKAGIDGATLHSPA